MANKTVYVVVPVEVPETFEQVDNLAGYLNKFIEIGINDLQEAIEDPDISSDNTDVLIAEKITWKEPYIEKTYD